MISGLKGGRDGLVNEGLAGKALCSYSLAKVPLVGIQVPFACTEVWCWLEQMERNGLWMGLCLYSDPDANTDLERCALMPSINIVTPHTDYPS